MGEAGLMPERIGWRWDANVSTWYSLPSNGRGGHPGRLLSKPGGQVGVFGWRVLLLRCGSSHNSSHA